MRIADPTPVLARPDDSLTRRIRVGVVGAGEQATTRLIPALLHLPNVQLVALADLHEARGTAAVERFMVAHRFTDVRGLLAEVEVDALIAACPPQAHEEIAACAIAQRVPVFVEKPPSVTTAVLRELAARAAAAGVVTGVGMNFRHAGPYLRIKKLLGVPEAGSPVSVTVRHVANKPKAPLWGLTLLCSFLLGQAIHPVDLMLDLGGPAVDVKAVQRIDERDVLVGAQVEFAGGAVGCLLSGTHACYRSQSVAVKGAGQAAYVGEAARHLPGYRGAMAIGGYREAFQVLRLGQVTP
ncbi:MAG: Gfo/Idh/MocA family protein [Egibacteraceae bacterium]